MELCLCFGCPHPGLLAKTMTGREVRQWMRFAEQRGLPTRLGLQVAQLEWFTRLANIKAEAHGSVPPPSELVVGCVKPVPKKTPREIANSFSAALRAVSGKMKDV